MFRLGIDLGGTKIESVILDAEGKSLFRKRVPTERERGYDAILQNIVDLYRESAAQIAEQPHTVGIGTPGSLSPATGLLRNSNTTCMNGKPVKNDLELAIARNIAFQNDANCFAEAEALLGAGRGYSTVFGIIMGTGCGGGIVQDGKVREGRLHIAGEWGHHRIDPDGARCYCGQHGCTETVISGSGVEAFHEKEFGEHLPLREIVSRSREGDADSAHTMKIFLDNFGRTVSNLINILDPDAIVIGGGVSNISEIYTAGVEKVREYVFSDYFDTPILRNELGDSAGVFGAALIGI